MPSPTSQKTVSIASAPILNSASRSCATAACDYDRQVAPAIVQSSLVAFDGRGPASPSQGPVEPSLSAATLPSRTDEPQLQIATSSRHSQLRRPVVAECGSDEKFVGCTRRMRIGVDGQPAGCWYFISNRNEAIPRRTQCGTT